LSSNIGDVASALEHITQTIAISLTVQLATNAEKTITGLYTMRRLLAKQTQV